MAEASAPTGGPGGQRHYVRGESLEFDRVAFFTDAVFAIAMTLLVVALEPPDLIGPETEWRSLWEPLRKEQAQILSFFLAFVLIARYWIAAHRFFGWVGRVDRGYIALNLTYLGFVAFLPFPTDLIGTHAQNPLSVVFFAVVLGLISGMEWVLLRHVYRRGLMRVTMTPPAYRYATVQSLTPVVLFALSIPVAFVAPTAAMLMWLLSIPIGVLTDRVFPAGAQDFRG